MGGVTTLGVLRGQHNFHAGLQVFAERDNQLYSVVDKLASGNSFGSTRTKPWANNEAAFVDEQFNATSWLTFNTGVRLSHYGGPVSENSADRESEPRLRSLSSNGRYEASTAGIISRHRWSP